MTDELTILSVDPVEIFGAKIVALLSRTAARDLYDVHNMIMHNLLDGPELNMLRKCAVFYSAIGAEHPPKEFALENVGRLTKRSITTDLYRGKDGCGKERESGTEKKKTADVLSPGNEAE